MHRSDLFASLVLAIAISRGEMAAQCHEASETHARLLRATATSFRLRVVSAETEFLHVTQRARLVGSVTGSGVPDGEIRFWVFSGDEVVFDSGQQKLICVDISLQPGDYTLVYDNSTSLFIEKTVWSSVRLESEPEVQARDSAAEDPTARLLAARWRLLAQNVVKTLNPAYRDLVRQLRVTQPAKAPQAIIEAGVYDFAERNVEFYEQILASSIAHTMAHALHAATMKTEFESERASLWREITGFAGSAAEPEIDRLTLVLLCQSGYGDKGLALMLKRIPGLNESTSASKANTQLRARIDSIRSMSACGVLDSTAVATIPSSRR